MGFLSISSIAEAYHTNSVGALRAVSPQQRQKRPRCSRDMLGITLPPRRPRGLLPAALRLLLRDQKRTPAFNGSSGPRCLPKPIECHQHDGGIEHFRRSVWLRTPSSIAVLRLDERLQIAPRGARYRKQPYGGIQ